MLALLGVVDGWWNEQCGLWWRHERSLSRQPREKAGVNASANLPGRCLPKKGRSRAVDAPHKVTMTTLGMDGHGPQGGEKNTNRIWWVQ